MTGGKESWKKPDNRPALQMGQEGNEADDHGDSQGDGKLKLDGIKIHPLHVIKGTKLEAIFLQGGYRPMELKEYVDLASEFLEYLFLRTVIQRISADCPTEWLVAPQWIADKQKMLRRIEERLREKGAFQGARYKN